MRRLPAAPPRRHPALPYRRKPDAPTHRKSSPQRSPPLRGHGYRRIRRQDWAKARNLPRAGASRRPSRSRGTATPPKPPFPVCRRLSPQHCRQPPERYASCPDRYLPAPSTGRNSPPHICTPSPQRHRNTPQAEGRAHVPVLPPLSSYRVSPYG